MAEMRRLLCSAAGDDSMPSAAISISWSSLSPARDPLFSLKESLEQLFDRPADLADSSFVSGHGLLAGGGYVIA